MVLTLLHLMVNRGDRLPKTSSKPGRKGARPHFGEQHCLLVVFQCKQKCRTRLSERKLSLAHQAVGTARSPQNGSPVAGLARFFPDASPVRVPVQLARLLESGESASFSESTVIEFGTPREVLFVSKTPLEFADILRVRNSDGSLDEEVSVVAVQYQTGKTLVAARFRRDVPNWIVKS